MAITALTLAAAPAAGGCNSGSVARTHLLSNENCNAFAFGDQATAVGLGASAAGVKSTALGAAASAGGVNATTLGYFSGARTAVAGATTVGHLSGASGAGIYSTALGAGIVSGNTSTAAKALGAWSVAIGGGDDDARSGALADGIFAVAIGNRSVATGVGYAVALGYNAKANVGLAPTAVGTDSTARGENAAAFGRFGSASAENSTALGSLAQATRKGAVAIGFGSIADLPNTVSVGTTTARRRIVHVAPGVTNTDVPTLGQVKAMIAAAASAEIANNNEDVRRELAELRVLIKQQQQEIAQLRSQRATAALQD